MRILVLSQYFWPETFRITEVVESLREAGAEVTVLTAQPNYPDGAIQPGYRALSWRTEVRDGLAVHRVPLVARGRGSAMRLAMNYASFIASAGLFGPWHLRGKRFDVVLVYAPSPILQAIPAVWIARLKGAKLVTWVQDLWPESLSATGFVRDETALAAVGRIVRWIYRRNDLLLAQSEAFIAPIRALAGHDRVAYLPNPGERAFSRGAMAATDVDAGPGTTSPPTQGAPATDPPPPALRLAGGFNVVFAGNLGTVQSLETIVAAAALLRDLPDVRFVIVGSGSRSEWLREEVARRGLTNVQLAGRFAPDDMPGILAQASALLVSLARSPILAQVVPSKVQAYLAATRPVVASLDGEGARVVEEAGAGVAAPAEDAAALAAAIRRLHAMPADDRHQMGLRGRAYYERHFEPAVVAERMLALFRGLA